MKINGKWYFNEVLYLKGEFTQEINGVLGNDSSSVFTYLEYDLVWLYANNESVYEDSSKTWENEAYRTIDFGAAYQEVSDEFYTWLTANAVQLSKPIPMTHPKGIRLLTKGKKCTEDIEVVPTFIETVTAEFYTTAEYYGTAVVNGVIQPLNIQFDAGDDEILTVELLKGSILTIIGVNAVPYTNDGQGDRIPALASDKDDPLVYGVYKIDVDCHVSNYE